MTNYAEGSRRSKDFNPSGLPRFSVIRIPFKFGAEDYPLARRFVIVGHHEGYAICLKATSQVAVYRNNAEKLAGCVYYKAGQRTEFEVDTAIQPDNQVPIPHEELRDLYSKGHLEILGSLPDDFKLRLAEAIENSTTMSDIKKKRLRKLIGE